MNIFLKTITLSSCLVFFLMPGLVTHAQVDYSVWSDGGQRADDLAWGGQKEAIEYGTGLGTFDPRVIMANLINVAMGFVGIIMIIMFMLAGFKIMLSGGNEDALSEGKKMIWGTMVGTFLIFASFGIAKFLIGSLVGATS